MASSRTRRGFLGELGLLAAANQALAAPTEDSYWEMVRRQFPFTEERVPMNAANMCPPPRAVSDRLTELTRDTDVDCSFHNRAKFAEMQEQSRRLVAAQLGVSTDEIALVRNTSEANNIINNGLPLKPGDEVVLWNQNHPTNNVAWDVRAARFGVVVKRVSVPGEPSGVDELIGLFERAFTARTRVLSVTHLSNTSGIRLPVRELCEVAHRRSIYVHLDGAQTWGAFDVNLREVGCDSYAASAQKWFVGPREAGMLYVRQEHIARIWPNTVGAGWGDGAEPSVEGARKFESFGQRDDARLAAVATAAEFLNAIGLERVEARVLQLAAALKERLADIGVKLVTPRDSAHSGGVCVMEAPERNRQQVLDALYHKWGVAGAPTGGLRLCPHIYNTMDHIDRAARAVEAVRHLLV